MSSTGTPAPVKRACDSCHRRKVKCIGEGTNPCKNCVSAGLTCTYNAIPQKKGPKGSRAKVLSELRESQQRATQIGVPFDHLQGFGNIPHGLSRTPGLLSSELVDCCVDYFFQNLYPTQPILHPQRVQQTIMAMDHSVEAYCNMTALCAYVLIQPNMRLPPNVGLAGDSGPISNVGLGHIFLDETTRVRKSYTYAENPTILTVLTSFFLFSSYFALDKQNTAWYHLREATTLAHLMGIHVEDTYKHFDSIESSRRRRLFWLLFITERAYAFKQHRPLTLYATINLPTVDEDPSDTVHIGGFARLVKLYKPFDETFFGLWNKTRQGAVPSWLTQLQRQLAEALPAYLDGTETQVVELRMTQQWLKTMVWQLAISHGFISSMSSDNTMSFKYPIDISRDLVEMTNSFTQQAMEVHGIGLIEKLFDVACTLIDVMTCVPIEQQAFEMGPRDYLNRFLQLISTLRGGQSRYLPLLTAKINEVLPNMGFAINRAPANPTNSRMDGLPYESAASGPPSSDATPYESPPPGIPTLRHGSSHSSVYSDMTPPMAGSAYSNFGPTMAFPQGTRSTPAQGLYQTHMAHVPDAGFGD